MAFISAQVCRQIHFMSNLFPMKLDVIWLKFEFSSFQE